MKFMQTLDMKGLNLEGFMLQERLIMKMMPSKMMPLLKRLVRRWVGGICRQPMIYFL